MCVVVVVEKKFKSRERDVLEEKQKKKKARGVEREIFDFTTNTPQRRTFYLLSLSHQQQHPFNAFTKVTSDTEDYYHAHRRIRDLIDDFDEKTREKEERRLRIFSKSSRRKEDIYKYGLFLREVRDKSEHERQKR